MSDPTLEDDSLISQDDIDKLMESSSVEAMEENFLDDTDDDSLGELSQDDIDSLMNSTVEMADTAASGDDDVEDDVLDLISQDDIDQLMHTDAPDVETDEKPSDIEMADDAGEQIFQGDTLIDASEAVSVQDTLITQETLDQLVRDFDRNPDPDMDTAAPDALPEPDPSLAEDPPVVLDDADDFLMPESDMILPDLDEGSEDVSQEDIDALLLEDDEDDEEIADEIDETDDTGAAAEDDLLISQDDIDTLLMAADQEDEDVLGDLMGDSADLGLDDELGDSDDILGDDHGVLGQSADEDQVVLEGDDDLPLPGLERLHSESKTASWLKSRLVMAGVAVLILLGITVPAAYFLFSPKEAPEELYPMVSQPVATQPVQPLPSVQPDMETIDIEISEPVIFPTSGNLVLEDFVILASDLSKELTYITADISIDYSDQRAYDEIMEHQPFYRDLIYDAINKTLVAENKDDITESDILWTVETALKKVIPGEYIHKVSFKSFKAS